MCRNLALCELLEGTLTMEICKHETSKKKLIFLKTAILALAFKKLSDTGELLVGCQLYVHHSWSKFRAGYPTCTVQAYIFRA